jgi:hypothetical protein
MPLVTAFNLKKEDRLPEIEDAIRNALVSMPALEIHSDAVDFVPIFEADDFPRTITRINVDLWERSARSKDALQELAARVAKSFQTVAGKDRRVKVVIRPYAIERSGWVSF